MKSRLFKENIQDPISHLSSGNAFLAILGDFEPFQGLNQALESIKSMGNYICPCRFRWVLPEKQYIRYRKCSTKNLWTKER